MKRMIRSVSVWGAALAVVGSGLVLSSASADSGAGSTPENPIQVASPSAVPAGSTQTGSTTTDCATTTTWTHTVPAVAETFHSEYRYKRDIPAVAEVNHQEYRWPLLKRTYTPAQAEVSHNEWTAEQRTRTNTPTTEYEWDKKVQYQKARWSGNTYIGPISYDYDNTTYRWRDYGLAPVWTSTATAPTAPGPGRGNLIHRYNGEWYYTTFYEYQRTGSTRTVNNYGAWSAWTSYGNNPYLSDPTLPANTTTKEYRKSGPVKVVDKQAVPASFSPWVADGYSPWSTNSADPADPDGQTGDTNPANLRMVGSPREQKTVVDSAAIPGYTEYYVAGGAPSPDAAAASWIREPALAGWTRFQERSVSNNDAKPAVVTYYAYNDQKVCETPAPAPTPTTEVLGQQQGKATGRLYTSCQRTVRVTMRNNSTRAVAYKVVVGQKVTTVRVKAESTRRFTTTGANRAVAKLMLGNKVLAKKRIPGSCGVPEVLPETGLRQS
ncbi:MAG: hypothetical protein JWN68_2367 [Nocardioides sp.]|uniref:hypothetical protein n=1 Tax=Nocardioides sp. TaxID=35761 RepID=UPI0026058ECF|nr:hypothetical protein [Nocardioides sp.]MCW2834414.1 hypothetical protein [Nocardioides sp.]